MHTNKPRETVTHLAIILAGLLAIGVMHHVVPHGTPLGHNVFQWLYYLPVVYASTHFGLRGGLGTAALAAIGYIPHFLDALSESPGYIQTEYAEVGVLFLVSAVTGVLADRERKRRMELETATDELHKVHQELKGSIEALKRADRLAAIGHLAANLAHEIRNPLASIRGAVSILDEPQTSEEMRHEFRGIIKKECSRLEQLLTNLLDFARPRAPECRDVDVNLNLDSVMGLVAHAAEQNGITLRKEIPPNTLTAECDPEQIRQVLLNLTLNAMQAMPQGGEIVLAARQVNSNLLIQVKDEGCGIATEDLGKIFDPFFTTKENGTGLGLSVAHQIVSQHGGTITAENNPSTGTTFSVLLPLRRDGARCWGDGF